MSDEISGDGGLTARRRVAYLWSNLRRALFADGPRPPRETFRPAASPADDTNASPGRSLTNAFLRAYVPTLIRPGAIAALEIGCGSGSLTRRLAALGYTGRYVGVDVDDRFDATPVPGFTRAFHQRSAHDFDADGERFDAILSISAFEHIPNDKALADRLPDLLAPGGVELHIVPSGWGLAAYLWHGYRQYTRRRIGATFGVDGVRAHALGGLGSFLLHLIAITLCEMIVPINLRARFPVAFARARAVAFRIDRVLPICPTMYAIERRRADSDPPVSAA